MTLTATMAVISSLTFKLIKNYHKTDGRIVLSLLDSSLGDVKLILTRRQIIIPNL